MLILQINVVFPLPLFHGMTRDEQDHVIFWLKKHFQKLKFN